MPIVTMRFRLPDENYDFNCARQGADMHSVLIEVDNFLRNKVKHGLGPDDAKTPVEAFEEVRSLIHAELSDRGIDLWEE